MPDQLHIVPSLEQADRQLGPSQPARLSHCVVCPRLRLITWRSPSSAVCCTQAWIIDSITTLAACLTYQCSNPYLQIFYVFQSNSNILDYFWFHFPYGGVLDNMLLENLDKRFEYLITGKLILPCCMNLSEYLDNFSCSAAPGLCVSPHDILDTEKDLTKCVNLVEL